jgi:pectin methylesterase-like acyl-CoA thioesterase
VPHAVAAAGTARSFETPTSGELIVVRDGGSIQDAVKRASPDAVIKVMPGTYREPVYIDKDNITLSGVIEQGNYPVLEGEGMRNNFIVDNNHENFAIAGSLVSNIPSGTGVLIMACDDVVVENHIITGNKIDRPVYANHTGTVHG